MQVYLSNEKYPKSKGANRKKRKRKAKFVRKEQILAVPRIMPIRVRKIVPANFHLKVKQLSKMEIIKLNLPHNLAFLIQSDNSPFCLQQIRKDTSLDTNGYIYMPSVFSLCDNTNETINAIKQIIYSFFIKIPREIVFDYSNCKSIGLEAQALMDVILIEYKTFLNKCASMRSQRIVSSFPNSIGAININDEKLKKMMFSVGSPANLGIKRNDYPDIIRYSMCSHHALNESDKKQIKAQKELDTSRAIDYVIDCLKKMGKKLTPKKRSDLCTVIGEILINAEEHSSLHHRFSMGYFHEVKEGEQHKGLFHLVILNFGLSIYEKFRNDGTCPHATVEKMKALSAQYTSRSLFKRGEFEEETLWTLYALQQGVTSVPDMERGNGTIQFIKSFFNIKGTQATDNVSRMVLLSGRTEIIFDGTYEVREKIVGNDKFNVMTFNDSGKIEDMPDKRFVKTTDTYFPGTIITAEILLNEDDVKEIN